MLQPGTQTPEELIASTPLVLFVTEMMGFGFNAATGDFSRGAAGFWIEDGKLAFPVSEITISSNLDQMLEHRRRRQRPRPRDLDRCPALRVSQMSIAGE